MFNDFLLKDDMQHSTTHIPQDDTQFMSEVCSYIAISNFRTLIHYLIYSSKIICFLHVSFSPSFGKATIVQNSKL